MFCYLTCYFRGGYPLGYVPGGASPLFSRYQYWTSCLLFTELWAFLFFPCSTRDVMCKSHIILWRKSKPVPPFFTFYINYIADRFPLERFFTSSFIFSARNCFEDIKKQTKNLRKCSLLCHMTQRIGQRPTGAGWHLVPISSANTASVVSPR